MVHESDKTTKMKKRDGVGIPGFHEKQAELRP